jgi:hypothetical protein
VSMTNLVCPIRKCKSIFWEKHYGVKLNCKGRGHSTGGRHLAVVLEEFEFPHYITIHKLVYFHGRSECRWVVITLVPADIQETQLIIGQVVGLQISFFYFFV